MKPEKVCIHLLMKNGYRLCGIEYSTLLEVGGKLEIHLSTTTIKYVNCDCCIQKSLSLVQNEFATINTTHGFLTDS